MTTPTQDCGCSATRPLARIDWQALLAELAGLIGARRAVLGVSAVGRASNNTAATLGLDDFTEEMAARFSPINPMLPMALV